MKLVTVKIYAETRKAAKIEAAKRGMSMVMFIHEAVKEKVEQGKQKDDAHG